METNQPICYGAKIRLQHCATNLLLRSVTALYSHAGGSGQQIVGANGLKDATSIWEVKPPDGEEDGVKNGQPVRHGDVIRLEHVQTKRNLHSHSSISPLSGQQEVTAYGTNGRGNESDNWIVDLNESGLWRMDVPMRLKFSGNGQYLHSHANFSDPKLTDGLQEVTAFARKDDPNNLWKVVFENIDAVMQDTAGANGSELNLSRRAPALEICLNAERYAAALVTFFRDRSHDELCFAIYAPWGRGKTQLAELLRVKLETEDQPTRVVFFQAWKYPTAPEVWVHLYETLADASSADANPFLRFARNMRAGIARQGLWPLFLALWGLAFAVMPKIAAIYGLWSILLPLLGLGGIIWLVMLATGLRSAVRRLWHEYLGATRHDEKLGLQATIGKDLTALLEGWLPNKLPFNRWFIIGTACLLVLTIWSTFHWLDFGAKFFAPTTGIETALVCALPAVAVAALLLISYYRDAPKNLLLVVDDLDRCDLSHLLHIIESIKLLAEEPAIRSRLQVTMLVEEHVLHAAIREKYKRLWERSNAATDNLAPTAMMRESDVIRETLEKLFSAHLRLPPLEKTEVRDLVYGFGVDFTSDADKLRQQASDRDAELQPILSYLPAQRVAPKESADLASKTTDSPPVEPIDVQRPTWEKVSLTRDEKDAIWDALRDTGFADKQRVWGPRAVRALAFRFQLARLILDEFRIEVGPKRLAGLIVALTINPRADVADSNRTVGAVAKQVT